MAFQHLLLVLVSIGISVTTTSGVCITEWVERAFTCSIERDIMVIHVNIAKPKFLSVESTLQLHVQESWNQRQIREVFNCTRRNHNKTHERIDCHAWNLITHKKIESYTLEIVEVDVGKQDTKGGHNNVSTTVWSDPDDYNPRRRRCKCKNHYKVKQLNATSKFAEISLRWTQEAWLRIESYVIHYEDEQGRVNMTKDMHELCISSTCDQIIENLRLCTKYKICIAFKDDPTGTYKCIYTSTKCPVIEAGKVSDVSSDGLRVELKISLSAMGGLLLACCLIVILIRLNRKSPSPRVVTQQELIEPRFNNDEQFGVNNNSSSKETLSLEFSSSGCYVEIPEGPLLGNTADKLVVNSSG